MQAGRPGGFPLQARETRVGIPTQFHPNSLRVWRTHALPLPPIDRIERASEEKSPLQGDLPIYRRGVAYVAHASRGRGTTTPIESIAMIFSSPSPARATWGMLSKPALRSSFVPSTIASRKRGPRPHAVRPLTRSIHAIFLNIWRASLCVLVTRDLFACTTSRSIGIGSTVLPV